MLSVSSDWSLMIQRFCWVEIISGLHFEYYEWEKKIVHVSYNSWNAKRFVYKCFCEFKAFICYDLDSQESSANAIKIWGFSHRAQGTEYEIDFYVCVYMF